MKTKEQLEASAKQYQDALETDLAQLIDRSKNILAGAAVLGISFWIAYKIFKSFSHKEESNVEVAKRSEQPSVFAEVQKVVMKELAIFLLGILKEKVVEFLKEKQNEVTSDEEDY